MQFDVYCDESRPDLLGSKHPPAKFLVIGGLWLATENRDKFKQTIHKMRNAHKIGGEFKWQKLSPSKKKFYLELVDWFFDQADQLRFRCIVVNKQQVNLLKFHNNDQELGFYKFYYQMLHHWILDCNEYCVFCDYKKNRLQQRLSDLHRCLGKTNLSSIISNVQAIRSKESVLIQLVDVLTGAITAKINSQVRTNSAKSEIISKIESRIGHNIIPTSKNEQKFNIFAINLRGGW